MKTLKFLLISLWLAALLSVCGPSSRSSSPSQTLNQNPAGSVAIASPVFAPVAPNTPVLSAYKYTCELALGGGTMTMNLAWTDRSSDEQGYRVYRDGQPIATLAPDATSYMDAAFVATGKTLSYSVEAFSQDRQASTGTITAGCR